MFPVATALAGAAIGGYSEYQARKKKEQQIQDAINALKNTMYDQNRMTREEDRTGDVYNTQIADATNNSALGLGTVLNKDTFRAINASKMLGQRASAINEQHNKMVDYNQKANLQIAGMSSEMPTYDATPMIAGGITGYGAGEAINKLAGGDILSNLFKPKPIDIPNDGNLLNTPDVGNLTPEEISQYKTYSQPTNLLNNGNLIKNVGLPNLSDSEMNTYEVNKNSWNSNDYKMLYPDWLKTMKKKKFLGT